MLCAIILISLAKLIFKLKAVLLRYFVAGIEICKIVREHQIANKDILDFLMPKLSFKPITILSGFIENHHMQNLRAKIPDYRQ